MRMPRCAPRAAAGALLVLFALAPAPACQKPAQIRYEDDLERTSAPAQHALHEERLRELMRSLSLLYDERLPQAMDVAGERARRREEIAEVARALADSAARIPVVMPADGLDARSQAQFRAGARALEAQARDLADEADTLDAPAIDARVQAIAATCHDCHTRFRPGGDPR